MKQLLILTFLLLANILVAQYNYDSPCGAPEGTVDSVYSEGNFQFLRGYGNTHFNELTIKDDAIRRTLFFTSAFFGYGYTVDGNEIKVNKRNAAGGPFLEEFDEEVCREFSGLYHVTQQQIEDFQNDYADGGVNSNQHPEIFGWPGRNNSYFKNFNYTGIDIPEDKYLAPWVDLNQNGNYDPNEGEYPDINGESMYWAINSNSFLIESSTFTSGFELRYSYIFPEAESDIFYVQTAFTNKGPELQEFRMGNFVDPEIGCWTDDVISVNSEHNFVLAYNFDETDGSDLCEGENIPVYESDPPVTMTKLIKAPEKTTCAPNSLYASGKRYCSPMMPVPNENLNFALQGKVNEDHYISRETIEDCEVGEDETRYRWDGNPATPDSYSMVRKGPIDGDRAHLLSVDKVENIKTNQTISMVTGFTLIERPYNQFLDYNAPDILQRSDELCDIYQQTVTSTEEESTKEAELVVYPNPATNVLNIQINSGSDWTIEVFCLDGKRVLSENQISNQHQLSLSNIERGVYFLQLTDSKGSRFIEKFVKL